MTTTRIRSAETVIEAQDTRNALELQQTVRLKNSTTPSVLNITRVEGCGSIVSVTDFSKGQEGQRIYVKGDGTTTIVNGSRIHTNTGSDKLLSANVVYTFTRFGNAWYESEGATSGSSSSGSSNDELPPLTDPDTVLYSTGADVEWRLIDVVGVITSGTWNGDVIEIAYTEAQVITVTGTSNRISVGGSQSLPIIDIDAAYVGQTSITTLGTIVTGVWNGSVISTSFTQAKIISVAGTASRIAISGTATDPIIDIAAGYVGQSSITTLGTITTGVWNGTDIADDYIASAAAWNAKVDGSGIEGFIPQWDSNGDLFDSPIFTINIDEQVGIGDLDSQSYLSVVWDIDNTFPSLATFLGLISGTTNITSGRSLQTKLSKTGSSIVTNYQMAFFRAPVITGGSITNLIGLEIEAMTSGTSTNIALKTNAGLVEFGDNVNLASGKVFKINNVQVVGAQGAAITNPTGGTVQDAEARTAIDAILARLEAHGLIAT